MLIFFLVNLNINRIQRKENNKYIFLMEESSNQRNNIGVTDSPHHGPTLSTSTSSFEALESYDSELSRLATRAFEKTYTYVTHDMNASLEDYTLLEQMNRACISKYSDMQQISENLATSSIQLKEKCDNLVPYLEQIDDIEKTVNKLEDCAYQLDAYSQKLEQKFNNITRKK
ncbi:biogenesis of lysosome-related organelles complex 1 subunit 2 [Contarinia nasturtii]|uniref:biogenesis of lysosome-related organelles complex 1 subunit 2 n=1 Tax=Contarinia nasturtii TaxID=265458 RepID=UPI0012D38FE7|nr:biogenesis of lysosome-related organelles complex 1 subunit 2 [Contarinia nasturtii]